METAERIIIRKIGDIKLDILLLCNVDVSMGGAEGVRTRS